MEKAACMNCEHKHIYGAKLKGQAVRCLHPAVSVKFRALRDLCQHHKHEKKLELEPAQ